MDKQDENRPDLFQGIERMIRQIERHVLKMLELRKVINDETAAAAIRKQAMEESQEAELDAKILRIVVNALAQNLNKGTHDTREFGTEIALEILSLFQGDKFTATGIHDFRKQRQRECYILWDALFGGLSKMEITKKYYPESPSIGDPDKKCRPVNDLWRKYKLDNLKKEIKRLENSGKSRQDAFSEVVQKHDLADPLMGVRPFAPISGLGGTSICNNEGTSE